VAYVRPRRPRVDGRVPAADDAGDVAVAIEMRGLASVPMGQQARRGHLRSRIDRVLPRREAPHDAEPPCPGEGLNARGVRRPLEREVGGDKRAASLIDKRHEASQETRRYSKGKAETAADGQILVQGVLESAHSSPPDPGQGRAREDRLARSTFA
jgi:hypothetical protein